MILQALTRYYQRLLERQTPGLAPWGFSQEKIGYEVVLAPGGKVLRVNDLREGEGKKLLPRLLSVPAPEKRTVGIKPNLLWDKTSYVFGVSETSKRAAKEHEAFRQAHLDMLAAETDEGLCALRAFLLAWEPAHFAEPLFSPEMLDANMVFRLDGELRHLHDRPAVQALLARVRGADAGDTPQGVCLVSGQAEPLARLHPPIKGVNGAQSSGASIVSFNLDAFTSYGKSQGENAPVSERAAFAYTTALNHLLRRGDHNRQRLQIGDATVVFWAEAAEPDQAEAAESFFAGALDPTDEQESEKVRRALEAVAQGRPLADIDPRLHEDTRMYVLGLSPNASRLSVRFWETDSLGGFAAHLAKHARDMRLEPSPWKQAPSAWRLALATAPLRDGRAKSEDVAPQLAGELVRAILTGGRYPGSLLANIVMRLRADHDLSGVRAAICKAVLCRNHASEEEPPVSLDRQSHHPAYLLGRLFAVLESVQRAALGQNLNATIRDRYYGAASATPASVFPMLLRNTQNHLAKLRKANARRAGWLEKEIGEIVEALPEGFPRTLRLQEQGRFAIGYYHQARDRGARGEQEPEAAPDAPAAESAE